MTVGISHADRSSFTDIGTDVPRCAAQGKSTLHPFVAIKYADQIRDMSAKDIAVGAGLPESYKTEIRKGINLAKYVEVKS